MRYKSEEAQKRAYDYINNYNKANYTRHEVKLRQEDEKLLQAILKAKKISFNQYVINCIKKESTKN